jgi:hypothetical protein
MQRDLRVAWQHRRALLLADFVLVVWGVVAAVVMVARAVRRRHTRVEEPAPVTATPSQAPRPTEPRRAQDEPSAMQVP